MEVMLLSSLAPVAIFGIATFLFHLLLIRLYPISMLTWKRLDYIWLGAAMLGVLASVGGNYSEIYKGRAEYATRKVADAVKMLNKEVRAAKTEICGYEYAEYRDGDLSRSGRMAPKGLEAYCTAVVNLQANIDRGDYDSKRTLPPLPSDLIGRKGLDEVQPPSNLSFDFRLLSSLLTRVEELREEERALIFKAHPIGLEVYLKFLGPHLLAFALALRMTKVTAEVKHERKARGAA